MLGERQTENWLAMQRLTKFHCSCWTHHWWSTLDTVSPGHLFLLTTVQGQPIYFDILYQMCLLATGTRDREAGPMEIPDLAAAGKARGAQDPFTDQDHQDVMLVTDSINLKVKG